MPGLFRRCDVEDESEQEVECSRDCQWPSLWDVLLTFAALLFVYAVSAEINRDMNLTIRLCLVFGIVIGSLVLWKIAMFLISKMVDRFIQMYCDGEDGYITSQRDIAKLEKQKQE